jgi:hypothetical protein
MNNPEQLLVTVAQMIPAGARVLDFSDQSLNLQKYLPFGCSYHHHTLKQNNYPDVSEFDYLTAINILDCLDSVEDFINWITNANRHFILSDSFQDNLSQKITLEKLYFIIYHKGLSIELEKQIKNQIIIKIKKKNTLNPRILILSYANCHNFGDRLGSSLIKQLLPASAELVYSPLPPFWQNPGSDFDLVIVGTGHSVFHRTLTPELLETLAKIPYKIGIFGTQYRALLDREKMSQLVNLLDHWYARNSEDIYCFGRTSNVSHLGDWLISAFPITHWKLDRKLVINADFIRQLYDLERTIGEIQSYRIVHSARLHPLLCALTSAEFVSFNEQQEMEKPVQSGKFRSLLIDIFQEYFMPNQVFKVDKAAVISYKEKVAKNVVKMRDKIQLLLYKNSL